MKISMVIFARRLAIVWSIVLAVLATVALFLGVAVGVDFHLVPNPLQGALSLCATTLLLSLVVVGFWTSVRQLRVHRRQNPFNHAR